MNRHLLALMTLILLWAAWLRLGQIVDFVEWADEIRTLWRSDGTFAQMLVRTPSDWPPTYGALMWGWARLAGSTLEAARVTSALVGVLAVALVYRAARAMIGVMWGGRGDAGGAALAAAVFAVMGYAVFAGVDIRAYGLLLALGVAALWLTARWLRRPSLGRGAAAAVVQAALLYVSYTSVVALAALGLLALVSRPRLFVRWLMVAGLSVALAAPVVPGFVDNAGRRVGGVMAQPVPPFPDAMLRVYGEFGGSTALLVVFAAAALVVVVAGRRTGWVVIAWALLPVVVYVVVANDEFLKPRYLWWTTLALALLVALAGGALRVWIGRGGRASGQVRWSLQAVVVAAILGAGLMPVDYDAYRLAPTASPPFRMVLGWFAERVRPGDRLIIDPHCTCGEPFGWDVFVPRYFPTGYLPLADAPGDAPRVWYLYNTGWERDERLHEAIKTGRREAEFVGPWHFLLRLYEGAPLTAAEGALFDGRIALRGAELNGDDTVLARGDTVTVRLWWSALVTLERDYSISVALIDWRGGLVAQEDRAVIDENGATVQTSAWTPGTVYVDTRTLTLPADAEDGDYRLVVTVYQSWDGARLAPSVGDESPFDTDASGYVVVRRLVVAS